MNDTERYDSVWDAIADTPDEAANLRARAETVRACRGRSGVTLV